MEILVSFGITSAKRRRRVGAGIGIENTIDIAGSRDADDLHGPADMPVWGPVFLMEAMSVVGFFSPEQLEQQEDYVADRLEAPACTSTNCGWPPVNRLDLGQVRPSADCSGRSSEQPTPPYPLTFR